MPAPKGRAWTLACEAPTRRSPSGGCGSSTECRSESSTRPWASHAAGVSWTHDRCSSSPSRKLCCESLSSRRRSEISTARSSSLWAGEKNTGPRPEDEALTRLPKETGLLRSANTPTPRQVKLGTRSKRPMPSCEPERPRRRCTRPVRAPVYITVAYPLPVLDR
jgi:hypothetical protein